MLGRDIVVLITAIIVSAALSFALVFFIGQERESSSLKKSESSLTTQWEEQFKKLVRSQLDLYETEITDGPIYEAVWAIYQRLAPAIPEHPYTVEIVVIDSPTVNAFTFPGGLIVIHSGLIKECETAEELAAVIAHEFGHIVHKDPSKALVKQIGLSALLTVLSGGDPNSVEKLIKTIVSKHFSREVESRADEFAISLMQESQIDPIHLALFFRRLEKKSSLYEKHALFKYISTHPETKERIDHAERMSKKFSGKTEKIDIEWDKLKKEFPSPFDS